MAGTSSLHPDTLMDTRAFAGKYQLHSYHEQVWKLFITSKGSGGFHNAASHSQVIKSSQRLRLFSHSPLFSSSSLSFFSSTLLPPSLSLSLLSYSSTLFLTWTDTLYGHKKNGINLNSIIFFYYVSHSCWVLNLQPRYLKSIITATTVAMVLQDKLWDSKSLSLDNKLDR